MKRALMVWLVVVVALAGTLGARFVLENNDDGGRELRASLRGIEEPPAVSSTGRGDFRARVSGDGTSIRFTLSYSGLEGEIQQSHIHLGQRSVNGGISTFLCSNLGNGPAGTLACLGPNAGTVSGTITAAEIIGPAGQGLAAGELEELLRAISRGVTYVNVHTTKHPSGEIRGQITDED